MPLRKPLPRKDRQFQEDEFFLRDPKLGWWDKFSYRGLSSDLFKSLRVAVVNDDQEIAYAFFEAHKEGSLFPGSKLSVYADGESLLKSMQTTQDRPNLVLTDLSLPNSSGYLVVEALRQSGYDGPIIAFSAFGEKEDVGREMFTYGLDGLISASKIFHYAPFWYKRVHHKIANYFYYKKLHQWPH